MTTLKIILLGWSVLALGACSWLLPDDMYTYFIPFDEIVELGPYEIDVKIHLTDTADAYEPPDDERVIDIRGYFRYPSAKLREDGCVLEIDVKLEGQNQQTYPKDVVGGPYEKNFPKAKPSVNSLRDFSEPRSKEKREIDILLLTQYEQPRSVQNFRLNLRPISEDSRGSCDATKTIQNRVRVK